MLNPRDYRLARRRAPQVFTRVGFVSATALAHKTCGELVRATGVPSIFECVKCDCVTTDTVQVEIPAPTGA